MNIINNNIKLKNHYIPQNLLRKFLLKNFKYSSLKIKSKNFFITKEMVDNELLIYNGKTYQSLLIKANMLGYKIGEFIVTRQFLRKKLNVKARKKYRRKKIYKKTNIL